MALVPLLFLAVFFVWPVLTMIGRGLIVDGALDLSGFGEVFASARIRRVIWLTVAQAVVATGVSTALGLPLAFVAYRLRFPGRAVLRALAVMPFVMPTVVVGIAFRTLLAPGGALGGLGLDGTWTAIIAALVFFNISVVVRTVGVAWEGLDPRAGEVAASLGASPWQVLRTVTLPALAPAIVSAASVVFLFCATAFGVVLTMGGLRYGTIETEIYLQTVQFLDLRAAAVLSILQMVVVVSMLWVVSRTRGQDTGQRRGHRSGAAARPGAGHAAALVVTAAVVAFICAPILSLVTRSLRNQGGWTLEHYRNLSGSGEHNALLVTVWEAAANSLRIALVATILATALGLLVAITVGRPDRTTRARRLRSAFDAAFMLPLGVSAVTVGFGFLITLNRPPLDLRTSPWLVPIAQATVALPLVVRTLVPVLRSIDDRLRQSAAVLGAGRARTFLTVDVPVLWRPLLAAAGFAMAVSLGEFGATSFLARDDNPTLPVVIYRLIGRPGTENAGMAMAGGVVLATMTVVLMGLVERLRVRGVGGF